MGYYGRWAPYVPVEERRKNAQKKLRSIEKKGHICYPVIISGKTIAHTFWGKKWCDNLEAYSDFENRLPRARSCVRHGLVIDLKISAGEVTALVCGSEVYKVKITVRALAADLWQSILRECAGQVGSLVELLQGRFSNAVMEVVTRQGTGLFPAPEQIDFQCDCLDWADMCKHAGAVLYGVGARLDSEPELLFQLRHVDPLELIQQAGNVSVTKAQLEQHQQLDASDLSALFGIELNESPVVKAAPAATPNTPTMKIEHSELKPAEAKRSDKPSRSSIGSLEELMQARQKLDEAIALHKAREKQVHKPAKRSSKTIAANTLLARGIPRHMHQSWLKSGILLHTDTRGVYQTTKKTEKRIKDYLSGKRASVTQ